MSKDFLPTTKLELEKRGWQQLDFVIISGDAYVDHPSFGPAIIGRLLESRGYKVGIISQPDWRDLKDLKVMGKPRLACLISAGNLDSMVNHYTVARKKRRKDSYSPGGLAGLRPDRASIVYAQKAREAFKNVPIILGGVEASLRRTAHFDFWDDRVRRSILLDSRADLLVYGMAEKQILQIAEALEGGLSIEDLVYIKGTAYSTESIEKVYEHILLPHYDEIIINKKKFAESFMLQYKNTDAIQGKTLVEPYRHRYIVQNPPADTLTTKELDEIYQLPYQRTFHPKYESKGGVPAITEVKFSLVSSRGCFGACNFCALNFHQGRVMQKRSIKSITEEAQLISKEKDFKGYIHDVGGPTANFRDPACEKQEKEGTCSHKQCLFPKPCNKLKVDHSEYLTLLRKLRELPGIKKVFIRSGIRFDYLINEKNKETLKEICQHHISGQLKIAPEHISPRVLNKMGKPGKDVYEKFVRKYEKTNEELGLKQFIVPYFMSSHPGSDIHDAIALAEYLRDTGQNPEQVQDFYPTPGTMSTCMYYTELDPRNMKEVYVAKTNKEKAMQRALIQYKNPKNYNLVYEALKQAGRDDLIGRGKKCLIKEPGKPNKTKNYTKTKPNKTKNNAKKKPTNRATKRSTKRKPKRK